MKLSRKNRSLRTLRVSAVRGNVSPPPSAATFGEWLASALHLEISSARGTANQGEAHTVSSVCRGCRQGLRKRGGRSWGPRQDREFSELCHLSFAKYSVIMKLSVLPSVTWTRPPPSVFVADHVARSWRCFEEPGVCSKQKERPEGGGGLSVPDEGTTSSCESCF
jgi:hypothetical protein